MDFEEELCYFYLEFTQVAEYECDIFLLIFVANFDLNQKVWRLNHSNYLWDWYTPLVDLKSVLLNFDFSFITKYRWLILIYFVFTPIPSIHFTTNFSWITPSTNIRHFINYFMKNCKIFHLEWIFKAWSFFYYLCLSP